MNLWVQDGTQDQLWNWSYGIIISSLTIRIVALELPMTNVLSQLSPCSSFHYGGVQVILTYEYSHYCFLAIWCLECLSFYLDKEGCTLLLHLHSRQYFTASSPSLWKQNSNSASTLVTLVLFSTLMTLYCPPLNIRYIRCPLSRTVLDKCKKLYQWKKYKIMLLKPRT